MALLVRILIITLPFVAYPRLIGSIKLSDVLLVAIIVGALLNHSLRPTRYSIALAVFFIAFSIYGFFYINFFDRISVLGGWADGLLSPTSYQAVACIQTLIFVFGFLVASRYMVSPRTGLMRFMLRFTVFWSGAILVAYLLPPTREFVTYKSFGTTFFSGTMTEKGNMAEYVGFMYAILLTYNDMPGARRFSRWELAALVGATLIDLALCRSDRGTIYFAVFNLAYFFSKKPAIAFRLVPVALLVALFMLPDLTEGDTKIRYYLSFMGFEGDVSAVGRYAALLLFPRLFAHSPIFGLGYGNYIFYRTSSQFASFLPPLPKDEPDSIIIQIVLECGIAGALAFFALVFAHPMRRLAKSGLRFLWPFAITYAVSLLEGITTYYQMWMWLFLLLEMIRVGVANSRSGPAPPLRLPEHDRQTVHPNAIRRIYSRTG